MNRTPDRLVTSGFKGLAGEAWSSECTESRIRHGHGQSGRARGCEFLVSARYRELEERHWVMDLLVEITDGPSVFCAISLALLKGSSKWR